MTNQSTKKEWRGLQHPIITHTKDEKLLSDIVYRVCTRKIVNLEAICEILEWHTHSVTIAVEEFAKKVEEEVIGKNDDLNKLAFEQRWALKLLLKQSK